MADATGSRTPAANGTRRLPARMVAATAGAPSPYDDPMAKVLGLDAQASGPVAWLGYTLAAIALLLGLGVVLRATSLFLAMNARARAPAAAAQEIEVLREEAPPPPPPAQEAPEPKPEPAPPPPRALPRDLPPPPPAPAQAGKVLTREPDPDEPVDLTGNTIVTGNADQYAGGTTTADGTSATAVRGYASPGGVAGATGAPRAAPVPVGGPDLSRRATPLSHDWNAPFPPEADVAQVDEAHVTLQIDVRPDGTPAAARVTKDAGYGFGRAAKQYAMTQRFAPPLDRNGRPTTETITIVVHFSR